MRHSLKAILRALPSETTSLIGAEVGVREGKNALDMIRSMNIQKLYLVDHFKEYTEQSGVVITQNQQNLFYYNLLNNIKSYKNVEVMKMTSQEASEFFSEEFFDFIYIDACHTYEEVKRDMTLWLPKVKKNRYLCGHDFNNKETPDVARAVRDFSKEYNLNLYKLDDLDWMLIK
jgi:hypothetical protein